MTATVQAPFALGTHALTALLGEWRHGGRAHAELAEKLRLLLIDGRIRSGTRLPAEREIAAALGVSRTTIVSAYRRLRERGILYSVQGSGSVLALPPTSAHDDTALPLEIDFSKGTPPAWTELPTFAARALQHLPERMATGGIDLFGLPELRERIAARFTERGAPTSPENILITLGAQHAIALVARTLLGRADRVVVETPGYPHALDAFLSAGARLVASPLTPRGTDARHLEDTMRDARPSLVYLMPDFHNPTGSSLADADRERLLRASSRTGTPLLVDETTAELDIDRPGTTTPFAAFPSHGASLITVGSVSKTVWSGLRIGWIRADRHLIERFALARPAADMGNSVVDQLMATEILPEMPRLLRQRAAQLGVGRDHAVSLLRELLPAWEVPDVHGGLALWVGLGAPLSSALVLSARGRGVTITSGSRFGIDGAFERNIRIPFTAPIPTLTEGIGRLAAAWAAVGTADAGPGRRGAAAEAAFVV
ncbi:GntR family transcriptional regulator [Frondihabitans sucicola]|uniref:GntR family transcriptional regulator n=1 Tax=Frondihabitans sucicola TaxID=1268041 RepID=A0ABM8GUP9_9MICO|nr:PLP-dependent aminotransferase family protein [Frondihabitans sucicola]BDZ52204.1 GntR family transcriptional regulator [Frondihabitans sucicola]